MSLIKSSRERLLPANVRAYVLEFEHQYGCAFRSVAENIFSATLPLLSVWVEVDARRSVLRACSALDCARPEATADEAYVEILRNFPELALGGAAVRAADSKSSLEFFHEISFDILPPACAPAYVVKHAHAARMFDNWLGGQEPTVKPRDGHLIRDAA